MVQQSDVFLFKSSKESLGNLSELDWQLLPWKKVEKFISLVQQKIYKATLQSDYKSLYELQYFLSNSYAIKLFAVKQITENKYYTSASSIKINVLNSLQKLNIASTLDLSYYQCDKFQEELNIELKLIHDKSLELVLYLCLKPEWEAKFKLLNNEYLFNSHIKELIKNIAFSINNSKFKKNFYVLVAEIELQNQIVYKDYLVKMLKTNTIFEKCITKFLTNNPAHSLCFKKIDIPFGKLDRYDLAQLLSYILLFNIKLELLSGYTGDVNSVNSFFKYQNHLLYFSDSLFALNTYLVKLKSALVKRGLMYDLKKTRCLTKHQSIRFLGFNILPKFLLVNENLVNQLIISACKEEMKLVLSRIRYLLRSRHEDGKTRARTNMPLSKAIDLINPLVINWRNYYFSIIPNSVLENMDKLLNEKIYRWYIKRLKKNRVTHWNKQCIQMINNKKRIAHDIYILELFSETTD
uniref:Maturase n=1 Tax=Rhodochaete parvula TaxID=110510 RepID=A0A1C9CIB8_9RHOD|nr:maturase [Rhodochaete parvula]ARO91256.1 putative reverse transcriptase/maturase [Rhodochaete parvula]